MMRWTLPAFVLAALVLSPLLAGPAAAADVNRTLVIVGFDFHADTASGPADPTLVIAPGDTLRLRIENTGGPFHTFTFPHFNVREILTGRNVAFVNITTTSADAGRWQFFCEPHSSGVNESKTGMIGSVSVQAPPPPPTPGFEVVLVVAAIAGAAVILRLAPRLRK